MYGIAGCLEEVPDGSTVSGMAAMPDMQGAGRIGRDKLQQDLRRIFSFLPTVFSPAVQNRIQFCMERARAEIKIDKTRARNFNFGNQGVVAQCLNDAVGNVTRALAGGFRKSHRDIAGKVAMAGVASSFNRGIDGQIRCGRRKFWQFREGIIN